MEDRTTEFQSLCASLPPAPPKPPTANGASKSGSRRDGIQKLRSFHGLASEISKEIASTSAYLSELTRLVKSSNKLVLTDGGDDRVRWLVKRIQDNMQFLHEQIEIAQDELQATRRTCNKQASQEATNVVGQLQHELVNASSDFKQILQVRTDNLKQVQQRKTSLLSSPSGTNHRDLELSSLLHKPKVYDDVEDVPNLDDNHNAFATPHKSSAGIPKLDLTSVVRMQQQQQQQQQQQYGGETTSSNDPFGGGIRNRYSTNNNYQNDDQYYNTSQQQQSSSLPVYTPAQLAQLEEGTAEKQMQHQLIPDQSYLRQRAEAMTHVESNIAELGTVFSKLATMVQEHKELVQRVEDNVDDAHSNITLSMETLSQTLTNLRTNKALFLKVLSVVVIFIILFITFFA